MGFFDSVAQVITNPVAAGVRAVGNAFAGQRDHVNLGDIMSPVNGGLSRIGLGGDQGQSTAAPEAVDPKLKEIRDKQIAEAKKFRSNLPGYKQKLGDQAETSSRRKLAETLSDVKSSFNRRGLLYSGIRQSGEVGAQADASNQLAQEKAQINDSLNQTADEYEAAALKSGLAVNDMEADYQSQLYSRALASMMSRNQGISSLLGAGGAVAGASIAKGSK